MPLSTNFPATVDAATGEVKAETGFWLATVKLLVTVLEVRPLLSIAQKVNMYEPFVHVVESKLQLEAVSAPYVMHEFSSE